MYVSLIPPPLQCPYENVCMKTFIYNSLYSRRLQTARQVFVKIKLSTYKLIENLGNYLYIQPTVLQTIFQVSDIKTSMEGKTQ